MQFHKASAANLLVVLVFILVGTCGCKDKPEEDPDNPMEPTEEEFDRSAMLANIADNYIIPEYSAYLSSVEDLETKANSFIISPEQTGLEEVRASWQTSLIKWQSVAMLNFGPAADLALEEVINPYPVDANKIDKNITDENYQIGGVDQLSAKGFQAIDYIIHGIAADDASIIAEFQNSTNGSAGKYMKAVITEIKTGAEYANDQWSGAYRDKFVENDGTDQGSSAGLMLNAFNKSYEKTTRTLKLGIPSGAITLSGNPNPTYVEAFYQNSNSVAYLEASLDAFEKYYTGGNGLGLDDWVASTEAKYEGEPLNDGIIHELGKTKSKLNDLQNPLSDFVVNENAKSKEAYDQLQIMVNLWKVDMMSALGVLITYQDNDGD